MSGVHAFTVVCYAIEYVRINQSHNSRAAVVHVVTFRGLEAPGSNFRTPAHIGS